MTHHTPRVSIVTSAHWGGDARLNRHVRYLRQAGIEATLYSHADGPRLRAIVTALRQIATKPVEMVILPDPELFFLGSALARLRGVRPIIDIHEDYGRVAHSRDWVPRPARGLVGLIARVSTRIGRAVAADVIAAAPDIAGAGDVVVMNLPDPGPMDRLATAPLGEHRVVYVGDVTRSRGAMEMIEVLGALGPPFELRVIGRVDDSLRLAMVNAAQAHGVKDRVRFEGRLPVDQAWELAAGAVAGLSLLHDLPAYRNAVATKLWEYLAAGIPPVVTDLPGQASVVRQVDHRLVCASPQAAAEAIRLLKDQSHLRSEIVSRGMDLARETWHVYRPDLALLGVVSPDRSQ